MEKLVLYEFYFARSAGCNKGAIQALQGTELVFFGSVNTPRFTEHSDIDLLIEFDPSISLEEYADNCFSLRARLVKLFKRKIDLVTNRSLSNPYFIADIEQGKQLLYGAL